MFCFFSRKKKEGLRPAHRQPSPLGRADLIIQTMCGGAVVGTVVGAHSASIFMQHEHVGSGRRVCLW